MSFRGFSAPPDVRGAGPSLIETRNSLLYEDKIRGFRVLVPASFFCDGASVPRPAWRLLGIRRTTHLDPLGGDGFGGLSPEDLAKWIELLRDGVLHDYLSRRDATIIVAGERLPVPGKRFAARTMAEGMLSRGACSWATARLVQATIAVAPGYWHRRAVDWRPSAPSGS